MTRRRTLYTVAILVLSNLVIRFAWLWYMHPPQVDDFAWYFSHATQMFKGQGYVWYGHFTSYWPIGYPWFLSVLFHLTGPSVVAGLVANILFSTGIVICVYGLTRRLVPDARVAVCAAVGYTILPSQLEWNSVLGSEELFTFLLMGSLWLFVSCRLRSPILRPPVLWWVAGAGFVMGLAADVRPIVVLFPFVLVLFERFIARGRWRTAVCIGLAFGAGLAVAIAPVTARNWLTMHHFIVISTNGGVNLWQGTHTNGAYYWSWKPKINPLLPFVKNDYLENQVGMRVALHFYFHHPLHFIWGGVAKWFFLYWADWNVVSVTFAELPARFGQRSIQWNMWSNTVAYYVWLGVCITGIVRVCRGWKGRGMYLYLPLAYCAYNTAIFFVFPAWDRFRYPMMPLYAIYLGVGCVWLWDKVHTRRLR